MPLTFHQFCYQTRENLVLGIVNQNFERFLLTLIENTSCDLMKSAYSVSFSAKNKLATVPPITRGVH